jgi:hypothetical protein
MRKIIHYIILEDDNKIRTVLGMNLPNFKVPERDPHNCRCFEINIDESLWISHLIDKGPLYFNPNNRQVTNEKGEVMFGMMNGNQSTYTAGKDSKIYVDTISTEEATSFLTSLKNFKIEEEKIIELQKELDKTYQEYNQKLSKHVEIVSNLHDKLVRVLAISGYNEFKNKIHIDSDGKVYIIDKNVHVKASDL